MTTSFSAWVQKEDEDEDAPKSDDPTQFPMHGKQLTNRASSQSSEMRLTLCGDGALQSSPDTVSVWASAHLDAPLSSRTCLYASAMRP